MPRACSGDLRERALATCEAGEGRQSEIARLYEVGERPLSAWLKAAREEGRRSPGPRRGGRAPVGGEREALAGLVAERSDATLAEHADLLACGAEVWWTGCGGPAHRRKRRIRYSPSSASEP